jgi:uncharacterized protein (DUF433 family)
MTARETIHKAIEELSEAEAGIVLEVYSDLCEREKPGVALGQAFLEAYRVRDIEEARRREGHPGIVFRDGTAGRRAALAGDGPEVWEIVRTLKGTELTSDEQAIAAAAEWGDLSHAQVQTAVGYYTKFRKEVDEMIAFNNS